MSDISLSGLGEFLFFWATVIIGIPGLLWLLAVQLSWYDWLRLAGKSLTLALVIPWLFLAVSIGLEITTGRWEQWQRQPQTLASDKVIDGFQLPGGSTVWKQNGRLFRAQTPHPVVLNGIKYWGTGDGVTFFEGRVTTGFLCGDQKVQDIWCRDGREIKYNRDSGKLEEFVLARPERLEDVDWPTDTSVMRRAGDSSWLYILPRGHAPMLIGGTRIPGGAVAAVYLSSETGKLLRVD